MTKLKVGEISKPRFEFRTFGENFDVERKKMAELSVPVPEKVKERNSEETYIVSKTNDENNTKIRDGKMDIKTFVKDIDGLEQWNPLLKNEFPLKADFIKNDLFDAFQTECPDLEKDEYSYEEFMKLINDHKDLQAVNVKKHRFGFMVNDTICEYAEVVIDGKNIATINSESTEIDDIKKTLKAVGLVGKENINYLGAIKRVIGMA
ncbi:MAG: hypothetical protein U9N76_02315 [Candidatus Marinimicrobia bacterium]|nr:hypothetical protein [Candidatus Neomarinimicrobiota bacterium]